MHADAQYDADPTAHSANEQLALKRGRIHALGVKVARMSPLAKAMMLIIHNLVWGWRVKSGRIHTNYWMTHSLLSVDESIDYIHTVYSDYKHYGQIERFSGIVAELGPGDNAGVALLMRNDGAARVDLIDRFKSLSSPDQEAAIYRALSAQYDLDRFNPTGSWVRVALSGVEGHWGQSAEEYFAGCPAASYDFIVSRAVLEHLYNPLGALTGMVHSLRPGGKLLHKVDLKDHGYFSARSGDELAWLRFSKPLWRLMTSYAARPNRVLAHDYRACLENLRQAGMIDYDILVTQLVGVGALEPYRTFADIPEDLRRRAVSYVDVRRQHFARCFRSVSSEDLAVSGIFLVVTKR